MTTERVTKRRWLRLWLGALLHPATADHDLMVRCYRNAPGVWLRWRTRRR